MPVYIQIYVNTICLYFYIYFTPVCEPQFWWSWSKFQGHSHSCVASGGASDESSGHILYWKQSSKTETTH